MKKNTLIKDILGSLKKKYESNNIENEDVYIDGYIVSNLGDDLLLAVFLSCTNFKSYNFLVRDYVKEADLLKSFKKTIRVLKKITNKKINIVNIKGSKTFKISLNKQENHKFSYYVIRGSVWPKSGLISEYEIQCVNKFGRKYSIGSNISKLEENFEIEYMKKIISLFDKFIVRDTFSYELSSKVSKTKIMLLADPVYSLYDQNQEINKKGGQLSVSLTYPDNSFQMEFSLENLFNTFKEEIINLKISNKITQINFISFQDKKDLDVINQFIKFSGQELFDGITTKLLNTKVILTI